MTGTVRLHCMGTWRPWPHATAARVALLAGRPALPEPLSSARARRWSRR